MFGILLLILGYFLVTASSLKVIEPFVRWPRVRLGVIGRRHHRQTQDNPVVQPCFNS
jgi:hypothetical protein